MTNSEQPSLLKATLISLGVAVLILVTVVLPAEFDIDPLGTGAALGLTGLSRSGPTAVISEESVYRTDQVRFELAPFESVEYKYRVEEGSGVLYSWRASGEVVFDMHAEPDGAEPGYAESFEQGRGQQADGTYIAPFPGIHGWFWENRGVDTVSVDLVTAGFYGHAVEFRDGDQTRRQPGEAR
jgi:hypothetical protein